MAIKIMPLGLEGHAQSGFSHKVLVGFADIQVGATTKTLQIFPTSGEAPIGFAVLKAGYRLTELFVGASITNLTLKIGDSAQAGGASAERYLTAAQGSLAGASPVYYVYGLHLATCPYAFTAADGLDALFTATGANLSALTAGKVEILLDLLDLSKLSRPT